MNISPQSGCVVKMWNLLIVTVLLSYTCSCFKYQHENKCAELGGECVSIEKCDVLKDLINSKDRDIVIKHICGFDGFVARVCCPYPQNCNTLEGTLGTCVRIEKCSYLLELMKSIKKGDRKYVQSSRCEEPARNRFCCDLTVNRYQPNPTTEIHTDNRKGKGQNSYNTSCSPVNQTGLISVQKVFNNNTCCGIAASNRNKIIGGEVTAIDEYPWLVMLEYKTNREYKCGGSLISSLYVLTAAHCLVGENNHSRSVYAVRLGEYNTTNEGKDCVEMDGGGEDCTDGAVTITINQTIVHPGYQSVQNIKNANDIGLLRLSKSAPYTEFIRPICLPSSDVTKVPILPNLRFQTAGWGAVSDVKHTSDVKLQVDLPVLEQKICEKRFSIAGKSILWYKQVCAGGELNKDTCKGDSGGPLTYSHDYKKHQIVGINSFGTVLCGIQGRSSVFTKVIEYIPWIEDNTKV